LNTGLYKIELSNLTKLIEQTLVIKGPKAWKQKAKPLTISINTYRKRLGAGSGFVGAIGR
tara:strand:- start:303 stop:482 length:180 start_codon:yes stop_codon:yes gene_type:complete